ncbi:Tyrosine-protein phosphatase [Porphyridium purpureum]|uniref:Tyrosine-protein phosphatase n=1 Tax=Porphyridium purpureum TaxID=35688 RepID=A0A5J4YXC5_PORPP|nr:Tyrosine-protein phosphatase [Porphyridium purpureum]|eukprot:POR5300..scf209_3
MYKTVLRAAVEVANMTAPVHVPQAVLAFGVAMAGQKAAPRLFNFRDVADSVPEIARGRLFRAANASGALAQKYRVGSIVDLRRPEERVRLDRSMQSLYVGTVDALPSAASDGPAPPCSRAHPSTVCIHVPILNSKRRFMVALLAALSWYDRVRLVLTMLWNLVTRPQDVSLVVREHVNRMGLFGLNVFMLQYFQGSILEALETIQTQFEVDQSVLITCSAGKDRTGLLVALTLGCAGVPHGSIVRDYALSGRIEQEHPAYFHALCAAFASEGLDPDHWARAPASCMEQTLQFIDDTYGSVISPKVTDLNRGERRVLAPPHVRDLLVSCLAGSNPAVSVLQGRELNLFWQVAKNVGMDDMSDVGASRGVMKMLAARATYSICTLQ